MYNCYRCGRDMKNNQALKRHIAKVFPCTMGSQRDESNDEFRSKVLKIFTCPLCSQNFKFSSQKSLHKKTCNGPLQKNIIVPVEPATVNTAEPCTSADNEPSTSDHIKTQYEVLEELTEFAKNNTVPSQVHDAISAFSKMFASQSQTISLSNSDNANVITPNQIQSNYNIAIVINNYGKEDIPITNEMLAQCLANRNKAIQTLFRHIFLNPEFPSNQTIRPGTRGLNVKTLQVMDNCFWKDVGVNAILDKVVHRMAKLVYHYYVDETVLKHVDFSDLVDKWHHTMCAKKYTMPQFFKIRRELYTMIYEFKFTDAK